MSLGSRMKERREQLGLTQIQFAKKLGVTKGAVGNYETDANSPKASILYKVFEALNCDANYLFQDEISTYQHDQATPPEMEFIKKYRVLDVHGQRAVNAIADIELERVKSVSIDSVREERPKTKIIPLLGNSFAAGLAEPDFGNPWTDYSVPADSNADFAIKINGNSMEPYLKDGTIALCKKETPHDGDVGAFLVDGEFLVKQFCSDNFNNIYLFSLNRDRADADRILWSHEEHTLTCFGRVIMKKRVPLPEY